MAPKALGSAITGLDEPDLSTDVGLRKSEIGGFDSLKRNIFWENLHVANAKFQAQLAKLAVPVVDQDP